MHLFGTMYMLINFQQSVPPIRLFPHILLFFFVGKWLYKTIVSYILHEIQYDF